MNENNVESHLDSVNNTGLSPARAFVKALAIAPIVVIVWSAVFMLGVFLGETEVSEWRETVAFGLVAVPLFVFVFYYQYRKGVSYAPNRTDYIIHIIIHIAGLVIAISIAASSHRRLPLIGAGAYLFFLIRSLLRKKEPPVSTNQ